LAADLELFHTKENIMRAVSLLLSGFALTCAVLSNFSPREVGDGKAGAEPTTVAMKSLSFDPKMVEVHVGDSVIWTNEARTSHTAVSDDDGKRFDTGEVEPGKSSKPVKFEKEGEFKYHCKVHGRSMSGTIVVRAQK
jgi:plastocyanin